MKDGYHIYKNGEYFLRDIQNVRFFRNPLPEKYDYLYFRVVDGEYDGWCHVGESFCKNCYHVCPFNLCGQRIYDCVLHYHYSREEKLKRILNIC